MRVNCGSRELNDLMANMIQRAATKYCSIWGCSIKARTAGWEPRDSVCWTAPFSGDLADRSVNQQDWTARAQLIQFLRCPGQFLGSAEQLRDLELHMQRVPSTGQMLLLHAKSWRGAASSLMFCLWEDPADVRGHTSVCYIHLPRQALSTPLWVGTRSVFFTSGWGPYFTPLCSNI